MHTLRAATWSIIATIISMIIAFLFILVMVHNSTAGVIEDGDTSFLVDRAGERWDITQAVSIGFKPHGFEFGIGRDAIRPLDGSSLEKRSNFEDSGARVIGVKNGSDAHAYVVRKLTLHEIANTRLGETPIAAAY